MRRYDAHSSEKVGRQDPDQEDHAGYPDERKKGIDHFLGPGAVEGSDGEEIDKEAEAQSDEETDGFNHETDFTQRPVACQRYCSCRPIKIFYLTVTGLSLYYSL
jgi:hypothetical protein